MAKIRNVSGEDRVVPALGWRTVTADEVVTVPDGDAEGFTCQENAWVQEDSTTTKGKG